MSAPCIAWKPGGVPVVLAGDEAVTCAYCPRQVPLDMETRERVRRGRSVLCFACSGDTNRHRSKRAREARG